MTSSSYGLVLPWGDRKIPLGLQTGGGGEEMRRMVGDLDGCAAEQGLMNLLEGVLRAGCEENWRCLGWSRLV